MLHIFIGAADGDIRPGSTGKAVPGYRATILDADGAEVPDGQPGRLAVKGPTGCRYLSDPRQQDLRAARLESSPATRTSATPTAITGTRPAATT